MRFFILAAFATLFGCAPGIGCAAGRSTLAARRIAQAVFGQSLPFAARVTQGGALSGITNTLFTAWMPPGLGFGGLAGKVSLTGNDPSFSEALVLLGTTADDETACARQNGVTVAVPPAITRLWAAIAKTNGTAAVTLPVNFALPYGVAPPQPSSGTCMMVLINAGFPYLNGTTARYTTTVADLSAATVPVPSGTIVLPFGMGGEFRFPPGTTPSSVYVGIMAKRPLAVDGIAAALSAAPVAGAPAGTGWSPLPASGWAVMSNFLYLPAGACAAANFRTQPWQGNFAVLRMATPSRLAAPRGAIPVLQMPMMSTATLATQRATYHAVPPTAPGGTLAPGDCLVVYETVYPGAFTNSGVLDVENQSTVYLRERP